MNQLTLSSFYRPLKFIQPAKTSRDTLYEKPSWFIKLTDANGKSGWGECSLIPGLSVESTNQINLALANLGSIVDWDGWTSALQHASPSLRFALETVDRSYRSHDGFSLFDTPFSRGEEGILINGLIWMGDDDYVIDQMHARAAEGFRILKMKIGTHDFNREVALLKRIRSAFPQNEFELRLDANGAFSPEQVIDRLHILAEFGIHSIEQPIRQGQTSTMAEVCAKSPIHIALDEELIGVTPNGELLDAIRPHYLILKPGLIGGFETCNQWITLARERGIGWWATSALESNIGLNAIAQWCASKATSMPQGLGTGRLFSNNVEAPLSIRNAYLYTQSNGWQLPTV